MPPRQPTPDLSVVVLCYRSAPAVPGFVAELRAVLEGLGVDWEMLLVANDFAGSEDPTADLVRALAAEDARLVPVVRVKKGMMGWDMRSGLEAARGRAVAVIDGDGQMPAVDVARVWRRLREGGTDLVKTVRVRRGDGFYRRLVSEVYNLLFRLLFPGLGVSDVNSKPKVLTRAAYERLALTSDGWFVDAEIMIQARRLGFRVVEVPTTFQGLRHRASFVRPGAILELLGNLLRFRFARSRAEEERTTRERSTARSGAEARRSDG